MKVIRLLVRQRQSVREQIAKMRLDEAPDIEIVGEVHDVLDILMAVKHKQADVVVASDSSDDRGMASHLLAQFPDMTLLLLGAEGGAHIEQRCQHRFTVSNQSGDAIADALRFAVESPCELGSAASG